MDSTGFSAFIADCSTTAIWDQRSRAQFGLVQVEQVHGPARLGVVAAPRRR